jgi:hypothetical protein
VDAPAQLADAQLAVAREHGFASWRRSSVASSLDLPSNEALSHLSGRVVQ